MEWIMILLISILSTVGSYCISIYLEKGPVLGSAVITLIGGLFLPYFFPTIGKELALVAACASYAGMIAVKNVSKWWEMMMIGIILGFVYIGAVDVYKGVGGKLGTMAAISCITWIGMRRAGKMILVPTEDKSMRTSLHK